MRVLVQSSLIFTALCLASSATGNASELPAVSRDLTGLHDAKRVLVNPHKGWYHHFPDNHPDKYRIARDADLVEFPGMDHLYIRMAWAYLEPREGQFDWAVIDRLVDKWTAHGLRIAFRISCKETSTDRVEQQFATPRWVMEAFEFGKGKAGPEFFRGAIDLLHATYIGYHGDAREWLDDNPELTKELLNRCGYWLPLPADLKPGRYTVSLGLIDGSSGRDRAVELALVSSARDVEGYYRVAEVEVGSR